LAEGNLPKKIRRTEKGQHSKENERERSERKRKRISKLKKSLEK